MASGAPAQDRRRPAPSRARSTLAFDVDDVRLWGEVAIPVRPRGVIVLAHADDRTAAGDLAVGWQLHAAGLVTVRVALRTGDERPSDDLAADVPGLGARLEAVARWALSEPRLQGLPLGFYAVGLGSAAALAAAAELGDAVAAVVSRGGRPDLTGFALAGVTAPTLLIAGSVDRRVLGANHHAAGQLRCPHEVAVLPGATGLVEEPGALAVAAQLACDWFAEHLVEPEIPTGL